QRPAAAADRARHLDRLVHGALDETAAAAPEEAQLPVGPEAAVPDPLPTEEVAPRHAIAVVRPVGIEHAEDLLAQLGGHLLIGVEREDPVAARLGQTEVLLRREAGPGPRDHVVGELARDLHGLVVGERVDHDDLVRPGHALETGAQALLLVQRDHHDREPAGRHAGRSVLVGPAAGRSSSSVTARNTGSTASDAIVRSGLWSARCPRPYGPLRSAAVGPYRPTHGTPSAAARCSGPVSAATI